MRCVRIGIGDSDGFCGMGLGMGMEMEMERVVWRGYLRKVGNGKSSSRWLFPFLMMFLVLGVLFSVHSVGFVKWLVVMR